MAGSVEYVGGDAFAGCSNLTNYYLESNAVLTTGGSSDPKIAQTTGGSINPKQVTIYTKSDNDKIIKYVTDTNNQRQAGDPEILLKYTDDPYSLTSVKPGSGSNSAGTQQGGGSTGSNQQNGTNANSSNTAEQKGVDGTALGAGASESVADSFLVNYSSESDPAGTVFSTLQLKAAKATKNSIKLSWKKAPSAVRFVIYGNKCGKGNRYVKQAQTKSSSITIKKIGNTAVKKGTYYKFIVVALDSKGNVVSTSKTVHVATLGGKVGNSKQLTTAAKKDKVSVKAKKTFKLKAKAKPASAKLKVKQHRSILYESTNNKIATVNKKGVIKGIKKGTCYVYAYAQNGICKRIKVTVK
ncbi:MAG: Ig-like domain-containing protein [Eubacterium sp.]|nr:Ig-like domain-containing protein [Eubacterium sp.]